MKKIVLTFDDACKSHIQSAAPLLKELGFGATFFICRFSDEWRSQHAQHLMSAEETRALYDMGFEIGNHTWNHPDMHPLTEEQCEKEIDDLTAFLKAAGIPEPRSFAYPGGPYTENTAAVLKRKGCMFARTVRRELWNPVTCDPLNVPAFCIKGEDDDLFMNTVSMEQTDDEWTVLVFHGVPDPVHPWVDISFERFEKYMRYLAAQKYRVCSVRDVLG